MVGVTENLRHNFDTWFKVLALFRRICEYERIGQDSEWLNLEVL
jgi:hypothetical protein